MMIELSKSKVEVKDFITWGDKERIQNVYIKGTTVDQTGIKEFDASVLSEAKYTLLEVAILNIKEGEKEFGFTRDWINNLSIEDGDKLYEEIDKSLNKKKD